MWWVWPGLHKDNLDYMTIFSQILTNKSNNIDTKL